MTFTERKKSRGSEEGPGVEKRDNYTDNDELPISKHIYEEQEKSLGMQEKLKI